MILTNGGVMKANGVMAPMISGMTANILLAAMCNE